MPLTSQSFVLKTSIEVSTSRCHCLKHNMHVSGLQFVLEFKLFATFWFFELQSVDSKPLSTHEKLLVAGIGTSAFLVTFACILGIVYGVKRKTRSKGAVRYAPADDADVVSIISDDSLTGGRPLLPP